MDAKQIIIKFDEEQLDRILQSYSLLLNQSSAYIVGAIYLATKLQNDGNDIKNYWEELDDVSESMEFVLKDHYDFNESGNE